MTKTEVLKGLTHETGQALCKALAEMDSAGVKYHIAEGRRTLLTQCLYALQGRLGDIFPSDLEWACQQAGIRPPGRGIITKTLKSNHLDGNAVDILPMAGGLIDWGGQDDRIVAAMKNAGFAWGGDWKDFQDKPHFECRAKT
jgi:hypothetical protein